MRLRPFPRAMGIFAHAFPGASPISLGNARPSPGMFIAHSSALYLLNEEQEEEYIMKSWVLFAALLMFVALRTTATVARKAPTAAKKQKAVMTFSQPIMLQGVMLKGEYLFVHD